MNEFDSCAPRISS